MSLADRRRNLGPTDTVAFSIEKEPSGPIYEDQVRAVFLSQGVAQHANGSAYLETGGTRVQCNVHGPQPLRGEFHSEAEVTVNVKVEPFAGLSDAGVLERTIADFVRTSITPAIVLKDYPKSAIVLSITVLSGVEGALFPQIAAAVNVATLGLVNAGIAMHDMVTAVSVASHDGQVFADVDAPLEDPQLIAAYLTAKGKLVGFTVGAIAGVPKPLLDSLFSRAQAAAETLRQVFNGYLVEDYAKRDAGR